MSRAYERIVLVGFMGAGKTSVGRELARRLGWRFIDLDEEIEVAAGRSVRELFRDEGEAEFRRRELEAARRAAEQKEVVIAAGGGAFAESETRAILQAEAATVWLRCDLETILERIGADPSRPLASDRETMRELLEQRQPTYQQALLAVDGEGAVGPVVDRIAESLRRVSENR